MDKCNWVIDEKGVQGGHRGEYDYICLTCGKTDWFAYYGRPEKEYQPSNCPLLGLTDWSQRPIPIIRK